MLVEHWGTELVALVQIDCDRPDSSRPSTSLWPIGFCWLYPKMSAHSLFLSSKTRVAARWYQENQEKKKQKTEEQKENGMKLQRRSAPRSTCVLL